jgi:hypothetical protein
LRWLGRGAMLSGWVPFWVWGRTSILVLGFIIWGWFRCFGRVWYGGTVWRSLCGVFYWRIVVICCGGMSLIRIWVLLPVNPRPSERSWRWGWVWTVCGCWVWRNVFCGRALTWVWEGGRGRCSLYRVWSQGVRIWFWWWVWSSSRRMHSYFGCLPGQLQSFIIFIYKYCQ